MSVCEAFLAGYLLFPFSFYCLVGYIRQFYRYFSYSHRGIHAQAIVKDLVYEDGELQAAGMLLEYTAIDGKTYEYTTSIGSMFWKNSIGKRMDILYDRKNPARVFVREELRLTILVPFTIHLTLASLGLVFIIYGFRKLICD
ncbi:MAG: DUF3592 domain-containing protein [Spirochaetes bacterium]|nr:DUF3592 domain-containing protein [Spirochaetota bacterium]